MKSIRQYRWVWSPKSFHSHYHRGPRISQWTAAARNISRRHRPNKESGETIPGRGGVGRGTHRAHYYYYYYSRAGRDQRVKRHCSGMSVTCSLEVFILILSIARPTRPKTKDRAVHRNQTLCLPQLKCSPFLFPFYSIGIVRMFCQQRNCPGS